MKSKIVSIILGIITVIVLGVCGFFLNSNNNLQTEIKNTTAQTAELKTEVNASSVETEKAQKDLDEKQATVDGLQSEIEEKLTNEK